jgi:hypothetical protein
MGIDPGTLCWVKIRGWPLWPCQVCDPELVPPEVRAAKCGKSPVLVYCFGDHKYVWSQASAISPYDPTMVLSTSNKLLKLAMAEAASGQGAGARVPPPPSTGDESEPSLDCAPAAGEKRARRAAPAMAAPKQPARKRKALEVRRARARAGGGARLLRRARVVPCVRQSG